jgi:lipopolysaccharide transport system permease protein
MNAPSAVPVIAITPEGSSGAGPWTEAWAGRELLGFLVWRDLRVRYRQTLLGAAWAILQPSAAMVVLSVVFGRLAGVPSDGVPYPVFAYAALVPWTYFASAVTGGATSLVGSQPLIAKVYFPRLIIPLAAVVVPLVDAGLALLMLAAVMAWYGVVPGLALAWLPAFVLLAVGAAASMAVWTAALVARYRDVRFVVPFVVQFGLFATPVAYPSSLVPSTWQPFYALNPMVAVVDGFRWSLIGSAAPSPVVILVSALATAALLWLGVRYFRRVELVLADVL